MLTGFASVIIVIIIININIKRAIAHSRNLTRPCLQLSFFIRQSFLQHRSSPHCIDQEQSPRLRHQHHLSNHLPAELLQSFHHCHSEDNNATLKPFFNPANPSRSLPVHLSKTQNLELQLYLLPETSQ